MAVTLLIEDLPLPGGEADRVTLEPVQQEGLAGTRGEPTYRLVLAEAGQRRGRERIVLKQHVQW